jgi:hypothetical protein
VGGYLQPRFRQIDVPTDFVALIDRRSSRDHLASYNLEVVRSLRNAGLVVETLEFDHDPSLCHFVRTGEFVRLDIMGWTSPAFPPALLAAKGESHVA